ncbi:hypothetical protein GCM10010168_22880 [Actinoplanes ianthinogenes]|uniref:Aminoglycoside phosphotransferase domain-containing protein n=1 Tax=Actinoplanes ianthinogenes TaxID=122358 RepID=A0ABM7M8M0_9ACTN|nr:aminoglycoside phosphotransferase family protein [Actinoplanes ianthinogenes]BCJ47929.1 hypothetical protein Aiant_85860 [Actinoplanes ianthinogenes]GGR05157.1 hypothetical protein GCM10010168_22880 [Actinoplanes ianthinogenes]
MIATVLKRLGLTSDDPVAGLESRSGAGIHPVRTAAGTPAFLKVTPAALGPEARAAAERELRFYREIAPAVPLRTPRLLDVAEYVDARAAASAAGSNDEGADERAGGLALLLEAAGTTRDVRSWTPDLWTTLGRDLAALHDIPLPATWPRPDALTDALTEPDLPTTERFWAATLPRTADLIAARDSLAEAMAAVPPAFVHGDCHTGNLVVAGDTLIFLDWQVCGPGRPTTDLAFPAVRATPAGVAAPTGLIDAYLRHRRLDRASLNLALLAEELSTYVFQWPPFAAYNTRKGIDRVRHRAAHLATRWFAETC